MKLITEIVDQSSLEFINESSADGKTKSFKIRGPFLEAETKNKNGRIYPLTILEKEVYRYNEEKVKTNRSIGELGHPSTPEIGLDRVSHIIEKLEMVGNMGIGTAKVLDTPMGRIASTLLENGVKLGVSTRGLGSLKGNVVDDGYNLICVDIVADPSAPSAFVEGILESKEWIIEGQDKFVEAAIENLEKKLDKTGSRYIRENLEDFLDEVNKRLRK